ncbi:phosphate ABC transporter permease subunit PstC [Aneurinibacillus terranovensis]|uniref:phosphate ABC transporter permease subunit PstC n=1 Tax=Aneurinibacillus terranovensis TaxID=278991 RepID=UPI00041B2547|nr:phosphate ABC transporter permease subunit PstC [Aneurinibacillus terranovensis]
MNEAQMNLTNESAVTSSKSSIPSSVNKELTNHPSRFGRSFRLRLTNRMFQYFCLLSGIIVCVALFSIIYFVGKTGFLTFLNVTFKTYFFSINWSPEENQFGAAGIIINTLSLTALTLVIATPLSIGIAIFIAEIAPHWVKGILRPVLDLLVGIPSVVYGYLGLTVLIPYIREWTGQEMGDGLFAAGLVLAIMVLPTITRIADDSITFVPNQYREAAIALGATRLQRIWRVILPAAKQGIMTAIILGMARAIGETMAVVMVIGNTPQLAKSLFTPTSVLTSNIVMQILNVQYDSTWNYALYMMAFLLLFISLLLIVIIRVIRPKGA